MTGALRLTLTRNQANSENGQTGFEIQVGFVSWHVELGELAQLFPPDQLPRLLLLSEKDSLSIELIARIAS